MSKKIELVTLGVSIHGDPDHDGNFVEDMGGYVKRSGGTYRTNDWGTGFIHEVEFDVPAPVASMMVARIHSFGYKVDEDYWEWADKRRREEARKEAEEHIFPGKCYCIGGRFYPECDCRPCQTTTVEADYRLCCECHD